MQPITASSTVIQRRSFLFTVLQPSTSATSASIDWIAADNLLVFGSKGEVLGLIYSPLLVTLFVSLDRLRAGGPAANAKILKVSL